MHLVYPPPPNKCWRVGSLQAKKGESSGTKTRKISPIHYILPCKRKMKYWLTISWQVIPTAANRIMMLIVVWRANRPVDVCLLSNLELFVSGYFTSLLNYHLTPTHQLCINRCSSFFLKVYVLTQSQELHCGFKDVLESLTLFVPNIKCLHLCQPRDLNPGMKSLLTFQLS